MRVYLRSALAFGLLWAASQASASDHPYGAPNALPTPAEGAPDGEAPVPAAEDTVAPDPQPVTSDRAWDGSSGTDSEGGAGCDTCDEGHSCCDCDLCCQTNWWITVAGLAMTRGNPDHQFVSFDANNVNNQILSFRHAKDDWQGGYEIRFGRRFGCGCNTCNTWGLEATYWSLGEMSGSASVRDPNDVISSTLNWGLLTFSGNLVADLFDNAREHRVTRNDNVQNVELNLLYLPCYNQCCGLNATWFAGARFFKFNEDLLFSAVDNGFEFGQDPTREGYYSINVDNNLVGLQIGGQLNWNVAGGFSLYATQRAGIFYNDISQHSQLYRGDGVFAVDPTNRPFDIATHKDDASFIGQLELGAQYQCGCHWSAFIGYRLVAISGIALADRQVPQFMQDYPGIAEIDSNANLFLHGGVAGVTFAF